MNWKSFLEQFDQDWQEIHVDPSGNVRLPDGNYQVAVDSTYIEESQNGRVLWKTTFKILTGDYQGRLIFLTHAIDDPDRLQFVKQDCYRLGFPITKLSDLPDVLEQMLDVRVEVRLKTNGEYQNCYIQKRLDGQVATGTPTGGQARNNGKRGGGRKSGSAIPPEVNNFFGVSDDDLPF